MAKRPKNSHVAAFIDLGTNSVRLLIVRVNANHSYSTLTEQKETIRLGEGEFEDQRLKPEAMQRASLVCKKFMETAASFEATKIMAVATAASREAKNKRAFINLLKRDAGLKMHVISGQEEARLIFLGVSAGINMNGHQNLFLDIGGGSTEIIVGNHDGYQLLDSLKMGAVRLGAEFQPKDDDGSFSQKEFNRIKRHVHNKAVRSLEKFQKHEFKMAVGSSGTIGNLAEIAYLRYQNRPFQKEDKLQLAQLKKLSAELCALSLKDRRKVPGINPKRVDIIISGAAILETLMEDLGLKEITPSDRGLRDGLLVDHLDRGEYTSSLRHLPVRERSVLQLGRSCQFDEAHALQVSNLALQLFDSTLNLGLHRYGEWERELLHFSSLLHDIGVFLSFDNHQSHSFYFIQNSELLGFNQSEIDLIATLTLYHRKPGPRSSNASFAALKEKHQKRILILSILLRIAESLERSHSAIITLARIRPLSRKSLVLELNATRDCKLEIWGLQHHLKAFRKIFGKDLSLEVHLQEASTSGRQRAKKATP